MRALVTGCAGFIGSHLAESLLGDGWEVVGIDLPGDDSRPDKARNLERAREWEAFELAPLDLSEGDGAPQELLDGCDAIFHVAAEPGVRSSWGARFEAYARNNVLATQRLLEAAAARPPRRFLFASSSSVYGRSEHLPTPEDAPPRPISPYGVTKLAAEHLCAAYHASHGLPVVSLRYFSVYGPRQRPDMAFARFCRAAIDGRHVTVLGDGRQTRDFTFVDDVVAATRRAAEVEGIEGRVYNVGGGGQVSVRAAIELPGELAGRTLEVEYAPPGRGDARDTCADTNRVRAELGIAPATRFEDGLAAQFSWTAAERAVPA